jgi:hypothetical protein
VRSQLDRSENFRAFSGRFQRELHPVFNQEDEEDSSKDSKKDLMKLQNHYSEL